MYKIVFCYKMQKYIFFLILKRKNEKISNFFLRLKKKHYFCIVK